VNIGVCRVVKDEDGASPRMPVSAIFENLEAGASIDDIMQWYDGLDREQVKTVIEFAVRSLDRQTSLGARCAFFSIRQRRYQFTPTSITSLSTASQQGYLLRKIDS
jgi:Protein of unknown function (DUF433)